MSKLKSSMYLRAKARDCKEGSRRFDLTRSCARLRTIYEHEEAWQMAFTVQLQSWLVDTSHAPQQKGWRWKRNPCHHAHLRALMTQRNARLLKLTTKTSWSTCADDCVRKHDNKGENSNTNVRTKAWLAGKSERTCGWWRVEHHAARAQSLTAAPEN